MSQGWYPPRPDGRAVAPGPRAGFWVRLLALLIDGLLLTVVALLVGRGSTSLGDELLAAGLGLVYFTAAIGSPPGQTLGGRLVGIRVVDARSGGPIGYQRALLRWLVTFLVGWLILPYLWMLWDAEGQTWQDKAAGDVVVPASWAPRPPGSPPVG